MTTTNTHGGPRPGAGAKPNPDGKRVKTSITLPQSLVDYLETTPNRSSTIEWLIRKSTGFRQFLSSREEPTP